MRASQSVGQTIVLPHFDKVRPMAAHQAKPEAQNNLFFGGPQAKTIWSLCGLLVLAGCGAGSSSTISPTPSPVTGLTLVSTVNGPDTGSWKAIGFDGSLFPVRLLYRVEQIGLRFLAGVRAHGLLLENRDS